MRHRYLAYFYLTAAMITVGSTVVASKIIGHGFSPFVATALRFAIALPMFLALMRATRTAWPRPGRRDGALLLAQAAAGSVGYTVCLIAGTKLTTAADAGVIVGTLPAVAALTSAVLLRERLSATTLVAIGLATTGVIVVAANGSGAVGTHSLVGNGLILAAVFCEALFILLNKRLHAALPPLAQSMVMTALGLVVSTPPALWEISRSGLAIEMPALLGVAYYAAVPTVAGFWLWYAGASRVSGGEASLFTAVAPVAAVVLASAVLGEAVRASLFIGLALVMSAVALMSLSGPGRRVQADG